jgi:protein TilB
MVRITEELLRKRAEHNEGCLSDLHEITLHQFEIEKIELVGDICRKLEILYFQNNLIGKIENLHHLKELQYLNLAVNNVTRVENLEGNESLRKLDLTCNYVTDLLSLESLRANYNLQQLFLIGNPVTEEEGYRLFVIASLPQLKELDGKEVTKTERILAAQQYSALRDRLVQNARAKGEQVADAAPEMKVKFDEHGNRLYGNTPEERLAAHRDLKSEAASKGAKDDRSVDPSQIGTTERLSADAVTDSKRRQASDPQAEIEKYGRVLQRNDGGWTYTFSRDGPNLILDVAVGKFIDTSLIQTDVHPTFVRMVVKGRETLQLLLPEEVAADQAVAQRSQATGNLRLLMPVLDKDSRKHSTDMGRGGILLTNDAAKLKRLKEDEAAQQRRSESNVERQGTDDGLTDHALMERAKQKLRLNVLSNDNRSNASARSQVVGEDSIDEFDEIPPLE